MSAAGPAARPLVEARGITYQYGRGSRGRRFGLRGLETRAGPTHVTDEDRAGFPGPRRASASATRAPRIGPIDLVASAGEVVGLVGPNGAGKSTLVRVLATQLPAMAGELRILDTLINGGSGAGRVSAGLRDVRRRIGFAPDHATHIGRLTGRENALLFARAAGLATEEAEARLHALLDRLGLGADADRQAREYSYGMARKLLLIESLLHEPLLLLLDEPTLGLDPPSRATLLALVRERARAGSAVVLASNDTSAAQAVCDRVVLIHAGRIALQGSVTTLIGRSAPGERIDVTFEAGSTYQRGDPATAGDEEVRTRSRDPQAAHDTRPPGSPGTLQTDAAARTTPIESTRPAWLPAGLVIDDVQEGRLRLRAARGRAPVAELCRALEDQGLRLRSLRVRQPDLRDAFEAVTGAPWGAADA